MLGKREGGPYGNPSFPGVLRINLIRGAKSFSHVKGGGGPPQKRGGGSPLGPPGVSLLMFRVVFCGEWRGEKNFPPEKFFPLFSPTLVPGLVP